MAIVLFAHRSQHIDFPAICRVAFDDLETDQETRQGTTRRELEESDGGDTTKDDDGRAVGDDIGERFHRTKEKQSNFVFLFPY